MTLFASRFFFINKTKYNQIGNLLLSYAKLWMNDSHLNVLVGNFGFTLFSFDNPLTSIYRDLLKTYFSILSNSLIVLNIFDIIPKIVIRFLIKIPLCHN